MRRTCVNFGSVNGGVDAFVNDPTIMAACHDAQLTVVQIMGANFLSNRFYSVHPRRNDRFLRASTVLQAIYMTSIFRTLRSPDTCWAPAGIVARAV